MRQRLILLFDFLTYLFMVASLVIYLLPHSDRLLPLYDLYEEDRAIEWFSVVLLVWAAFNFFFRKPKSIYWISLGFILLFLAGEETSWFQRVLGLESNEFFIAWNDQRETNLHGLQVNNYFLEHILLVMFGIFVLPIFYPLQSYFKNIPKPSLGLARYIVIAILVIAINLKTDESQKENVLEEAVELFIYAQLFRASLKQQ